MLNRRHLRVKVLQALYSYYQNREENYEQVRKELFQGIERIYDLYLYLLLTFPELKTIALQRIEDAKKKFLPTEEDLNPNLKFVNNRVIQWIEEDVNIRTESENRKVNWGGDVHQEMFRKMFLHIKDSEVYDLYMNNGVEGFEEDKAFAVDLFKTEIANFPLLYDFFEEKYIYWLDDIDLACVAVVKTIKNLDENGNSTILPLYKDKDDELTFVKNLLDKTITRGKETEEIIDYLTENWDLDRIAKMDILLMKMAITELLEFESIPTKVSINEYIEISKYYSTPKSNKFINGILDKAVEYLTEQGKIKKVGRGLMS